MRIQGPDFYMLPFEGFDEEVLALNKWYNSKDYKNMFRHMPRVLKSYELKEYSKLIGAEVMVIRENKTDTPVGLVTFAQDCKTNKAVYAGILIDKEYQKKRFPMQAFAILFNYIFNDLGYRKIIVEILEDHESLKRTIVESKFRFEGKLWEECFMDGEFKNELRYSMTDKFFNKHFKPLINSWRN